MNAPVENFIEPTFGHIPLASIVPSQTNPRKRFDDTDLADLAASIKQLGVCQPILVRPLPTSAEYIDAVEIVAGERRYRASKLAGLESIPAICRQMTDAEVLEVQVVENLQRRDVHPIEEAEGYDKLMKLHGYMVDQLADKVGKSRAYIYARLKLCALVQPARDAFFEDKLTASTALLIARIPAAELQESATKEITTGNGGEPMSYRRAVEHIQARYMLNLSTAPFSISDAKLVAGAGSCRACPKRTGNQPELFSDVTLADVCTDPDCFATKRIAHGQKAIAQAKKKGIPVFDSVDDAPEELTSSDEHLWSFERRAGNVDGFKKIVELLPVDQRPTPQGYVEQEGKVIELYDKTAMQEALEKAGLCETVERHTARMNEKLAQVDPAKAAAEAEKERLRQAEREHQKQLAEKETLVRVTAYRQVRTAMASGLTADAWRVVAREILLGDCYFAIPNDSLPEVYKWQGHSNDAAAAHLDCASFEDVQLAIMDMVFSETLTVTVHGLDGEGKFDSEERSYKALVSLCSVANVDIDQVRADLAPEAKEDLPLVIAGSDESVESSALDEVIAEEIEPPPAKAKGKRKKTKPAESIAADDASEQTAVAPADAWPFPTGARP